MTRSPDILVADALPRDREGLKALLEKEGLTCRIVGSPDEAKQAVAEFFFERAVIDLDFGGVGEGLQLLRFMRERSPGTVLVMLAARRSFEAAVEAFRLGVKDVIVKHPREIPRLRTSVLQPTQSDQALVGDSQLLRSAQAVLEDALKIMLDMGRTLYKDASDSILLRRPRVLLIDSDEETIAAIRGRLDPTQCDLHTEVSGGAALEKTSEQPFDIVAVCEQLPDMSGATVVTSIQGYHVDTIGLVYSRDPKNSWLRRQQSGQVTLDQHPFRGVTHVLEVLQAQLAELAHLQEERRYIRAFRRHHEAFLRRYADLKMRLDNLG